MGTETINTTSTATKRRFIPGKSPQRVTPVRTLDEQSMPVSPSNSSLRSSRKRQNIRRVAPHDQVEEKMQPSPRRRPKARAHLQNQLTPSGLLPRDSSDASL